jgi:hypothetical protein
MRGLSPPTHERPAGRPGVVRAVATAGEQSVDLFTVTLLPRFADTGAPAAPWPPSRTYAHGTGEFR